MKQNMKDSTNGASKLLGRMASEKKKSMIALGLIAVMVFMWAKVFFKSQPQSAQALFTTEQLKGQTNTKLEILFTELPDVSGRNDVITRDFFDSGGWQGFIDGKGENLVDIEKMNLDSEVSEALAIRIGEKLKLEAIGMGDNPQAFINGKLLSVGDKLLVSDIGIPCECEVVEIEENRVFVKCGEVQITLKLTQASTIDD